MTQLTITSIPLMGMLLDSILSKIEKLQSNLESATADHKVILEKQILEHMDLAEKIGDIITNATKG